MINIPYNVLEVFIDLYNLTLDRYVNGHAKAHYEGNNEHMICVDCETCAAYWYDIYLLILNV